MHQRQKPTWEPVVPCYFVMVALVVTTSEQIPDSVAQMPESVAAASLASLGSPAYLSCLPHYAATAADAVNQLDNSSVQCRPESIDFACFASIDCHLEQRTCSHSPTMAVHTPDRALAIPSSASVAFGLEPSGHCPYLDSVRCLVVVSWW